jgi:uncharacterized membrane protein
MLVTSPNFGNAVDNPIAGAIVGGLIAGFFALIIAVYVTNKYQARRARFEIRHELISQMTETAGGLYFNIKQYKRAKGGEFGPNFEEESLRASMDEEYKKNRINGRILQYRLDAYVGYHDLSDRWHAVMDLLTILYYTALNIATDELRAKNAPDPQQRHSGLSADKLKSFDLVEHCYKSELKSAVEAVKSLPIVILGD